MAYWAVLSWNPTLGGVLSAGATRTKTSLAVDTRDTSVKAPVGSRIHGRGQTVAIDGHLWKASPVCDLVGGAFPGKTIR